MARAATLLWSKAHSRREHISTHGRKRLPPMRRNQQIRALRKIGVCSSVSATALRRNPKVEPWKHFAASATNR